MLCSRGTCMYVHIAKQVPTWTTRTTQLRDFSQRILSSALWPHSCTFFDYAGAIHEKHLHVQQGSNKTFRSSKHDHVVLRIEI
jgi:hypothetical protein